MQVKRLLAVLLVLAVAVTWPGLSLGDAVNAPLRVGLYYNATAPAAVTVSASGGLVMGIGGAGGEWPRMIYAFPAAGALTVKQEGGAYWVAGADLPDLAAAEALLNVMQPGVLMWTGRAWQVWSGPFAGEAEAQAAKVGAEAGFPAESWRVAAPDSSRSEVRTAAGSLVMLFSSGDLYLAARDYGSLSVQGQTQKGWLHLIRDNSRFTVINYVDMEEYLTGVVPREMSPSKPLEALKVQAVASRTFALTCTKHQGMGFDVCTTTCCQVLDYGRATAASNEAVRATAGQVLTYGGKMVPVYFHAHSGGHTEDPLYVWGSSIPYLAPVADLYPTNSGYEYWEERLSAAEVEQLLGQMGVSVGRVLSMEALSYTAAGRVQRLQVVGSQGTRVLEKEQIRLNLRLKSRMYTIQADLPAVSLLGAGGAKKSGNPSGLTVVAAGGKQTTAANALHVLGAGKNTRSLAGSGGGDFLFVGSGYGHGVGISQHGAYAMAERGHSYREIIKHYIPLVEIRD